jgi:hypothetical protein
MLRRCATLSFSLVATLPSAVLQPEHGQTVISVGGGGETADGITDPGPTLVFGQGHS